MTNLPVALLFAMTAGFGMMSQTTVSNTIIQTNVSGEMRGRVISYFAMAFFGMQPLGGLLIGTVSQYIGAPNTILAEGIVAVLIALLFLPFLRKDILKEKDKIELGGIRRSVSYRRINKQLNKQYGTKQIIKHSFLSNGCAGATVKMLMTGDTFHLALLRKPLQQPGQKNSCLYSGCRVQKGLS